jgi:hypothetical protein
MESGVFIRSFGTAHEEGDPLIAQADVSRYFTVKIKIQKSPIINRQSFTLSPNAPPLLPSPGPPAAPQPARKFWPHRVQQRFN